MARDKYTYDQQYLRDNIKKITLTFNKKKGEDQKLYDWISSRPENMVAYVKRLVSEDIARSKAE